MKPIYIFSLYPDNENIIYFNNCEEIISWMAENNYFPDIDNDKISAKTVKKMIKNNDFELWGQESSLSIGFISEVSHYSQIGG
jgi:ABC-type uncharacterized transport system substrate-binding protein